jgi:hypothetical protein
LAPDTSAKDGARTSIIKAIPISKVGAAIRQASSWFGQAAASAARTSAGGDFEPVFLMMVARWLSAKRILSQPPHG